MTGGPHTHSFAYDELDRLPSAAAELSVQEGQYSESYGYAGNEGKIGNPSG